MKPYLFATATLFSSALIPAAWADEQVSTIADKLQQQHIDESAVNEAERTRVAELAVKRAQEAHALKQKENPGYGDRQQMQDVILADITKKAYDTAASQGKAAARRFCDAIDAGIPPHSALDIAIPDKDYLLHKRTMKRSDIAAMHVSNREQLKAVASGKSQAVAKQIAQERDKATRKAYAAIPANHYAEQLTFSRLVHIGFSPEESLKIARLTMQEADGMMGWDTEITKYDGSTHPVTTGVVTYYENESKRVRIFYNQQLGTPQSSISRGLPCSFEAEIQKREHDIRLAKKSELTIIYHFSPCIASNNTQGVMRQCLKRGARM